MTTVAITTSLPNTLPAPIEVVPAALVPRLDAVRVEYLRLRDLTITDDSQVEPFNRLALELHTLQKELVAASDRLKKPINQLKQAIQDVHESAITPVLEAKNVVAAKLGRWRTEQQRREAEARLAREAEERRRKEEAERAERARQEEQRRLQAEADAKATADAAEMEALLGSPVAPIPQRVEIQPTPSPAPAAPLPPVPAAAPVAVTVKMVPKLDIYDPRALAQAYEVGGVVLVDPRRGEVERLLKAGVAVPGARMVEVEQVAMRGVRA